MADNQCTAAPARQQARDKIASLAVEIVRGLVQQQEVRRLEDQRGKGRAGSLPAGQGSKRRRRVRLQSRAAETFGQPGFECPVGFGEVTFRRLPRFGLAQPGEPGAHAEQVGQRHAFGRGLQLPKDTDATVGRDFPGRRRLFACDQAQQRRLADAVSAGNPGPFLIEAEV